MKQSSPGVSVVIPTFNRSKYIDALLGSLQTAADNYDGPSEVIIVDDSDPSEAAITCEICEQYGVCYLPGTKSVRRKRNLGIQHAQYPIVLFVDSDCTVSSDLFSQHARSYAEPDETVAGVVGVTEFVGKDTWMWEVIRRTQFLNAFSFARRMEFAPWATCSNTSYRREVLNQLGGFDTSFPFRLGGDDVDLGLRLNKSGYRIKCNPNAKVFHTRETWNSFFAVCRRALRWGRMDVHLYYRKHNGRVVTGTPKFGHIFLVLSLVGLIETILTVSPWPLALPFIWASLTLIVQTAGTVLVTGKQWQDVPCELLADILGLTFEFGTLLEGIRRLEPAVLYKTVRRGPVLPTFERQEWVVQAWSMWLGMAMTLLVQGVWKW